MANLHIIESEVLGVKNEVYRLKVSVLELGLHMWGFRAQKSSKSISGWWIQPPATKTPSGWKKNPEFDTTKTLWSEIERTCVEVVKLYVSNVKEVYMPSDEELTDEAIAKSLNNIPDGDSISGKAIPWMNDED